MQALLRQEVHVWVDQQEQALKFVNAILNWELKEGKGCNDRINALLSLEKIKKGKRVLYPFAPFKFPSPYTFFDLGYDILSDFYWLQNTNPSDMIVVEDSLSLLSKIDTYTTINRVLRLMVMRNELEDGFLLHGILLRHRQKNIAIIYAGDSGVGKTTAAIRTPDELWQKCSDDVVMIVYDSEKKEYQAHAWPGSKAYLQPELRYDTKNRVPLKGIFFLSHSQSVCLEESSKIQSIANLQRLINEHAPLPDPSIDPEGVGEMRKNRLKNLSDFVQTVPCYELSLNLTDPFWEMIEEVLP